MNDSPGGSVDAHPREVFDKNMNKTATARKKQIRYVN